MKKLSDLIREYGEDAVTEVLALTPRDLDEHELECILRIRRRREEIALYHAQMSWLTAVQLHALLGAENFDVPDASTLAERRPS